MRILLVHNYYRQRGGEDVIVEQEARLLREAGHEITIYSRNNSEIQDHSLWRRLDAAQQAIWARETYNKIKALFESSRPDLVHVHNTLLLISPSVYSACRDYRVPVVQTLHNYRLFCPGGNFVREGVACEQCLKGSLLRSVTYSCYRRSRSATTVLAFMLAFHRARRTWDGIQTFIALSNFAKQKFVQAGLPAQKLTVKPNFVYPDPGIRKTTGEFVLYVGRLSAEKGVDALLRAWAKTEDNIPLVVAGDGPLRQQLSFQYSGDARIRFCGHIPRQQLFEAMKNARFLIVPSRCYENFPMAIVEAFACGVPIIASEIGSIEEVIDPGLTGLLFPPGDVTGLAERVAWAWNHPSHMLRMGSNCRAAYEANYTAERNYEGLMKIYQQTLSQSAEA